MRGLTLALLLLLNLQAHAQIIGGAPFGLSWGMSKADAERNGIALTESPGATFGKSFSARNLPRVLTDTEQVVLSFGHDDRLWRIAAISRTWRNDAHGQESKARFDELAALLTERYGQGKSLAQAPTNEFYRRSEYFAYGIHLNERVHATDWKTKDMDIQLSLRAASMNDLYYLLLYESRALAVAFRKSQSGREKDAL